MQDGALVCVIFLKGDGYIMYMFIDQYKLLFCVLGSYCIHTNFVAHLMIISRAFEIKVSDFQRRGLSGGN